MTTLRNHLFENGKFKHIAADDMAKSIRDHAKEHESFRASNATAIFRFTNLSINYLATECCEDDFTFESLFKLLFAEAYDENYLTARKTVFDFLMEQAIEADRCLYNMYKSYLAVYDEMPPNAFDLFLFSVEKYCNENDLEFDPQNVVDLRDNWLKMQGSENIAKDSNKPKQESSEDVECAINILHFFNRYRLMFKQEDLTKAFALVCELNNTKLRDGFNEMLTDFDDHKSVYIAVEELIH
ncbi:MAG: hypothetical protein IKJ85_05940 [Firmicutes bacterium]|nr:hypothetical protein [Bacillota bacterium]